MHARSEGMGAFTEAEGGVHKFGAAMLAVGAIVASVVAGAIAVSTKWAMDFQRDLVMIHTQAGDTTADLKKIAAGLEALSPQVGYGPDELAKSLYHVESAGFRGAKALDMVRQAAQLAQVGGAGLESTTQAVIAAISALGDRGLTASRAVAILNATVGAGDMRMENLASSMGTGILVAARNAGLAFTDVGAAMATLTDNATPPEEAATRLRMTFSMMGAPTHAAQAALKSIGITATQLGEDMHKPNGLLMAIGELKKHLEDSGKTAVEQNAVIARAFGGGRSSAAIETLLSEFDRFKDKYAAIEKGARSFAQAWADTQQTTAFQTKAMEANIQDLGTIAGAAFLPMLNSLLGAALPALKGLSIYMAGPGVSGITAIGDHARATGATVMGMAQQFLSSKQFGEVMTAAVKTFGPIFEDAKKAVADFMREHKKDFDAIWKTTQEIMGEIAPLVIAILNAVRKFWQDHGAQVISIVKGFLNVVIGVVGGVMNLIKDIIKLVTDIIKGDWGAVWKDVVKIIQDAVLLVLNTILNLAVLAKKGFDFLISEAWEFAKGLIAGIVTGIKNGAGAIWDALKNALGDAWDKAKNFLGIHSPSAVFAESIGKPISQGIGKGILDAAGDAHGALSSMLGAMVPSAGGGGSLALAGAGGGGSQIIFDFRGSQMMSDADMDKLAGKLMPALGRAAVGAGIKFRV